MSATTSNKDELSPTHEHIIAGIVILLFGLLYCFFNCDWTNNTLPASTPPPIANAVNGTLKKGLPVTAAATGAVVASTVVNTKPDSSTAKNTDEEKANSASQLVATTEENTPEVSDSEATEEIAKTDTEEQAPEETAETTETEPQPAEQVVENTEATPEEAVAEEAAPLVAAQPDEEATDTKAQVPDSYKLPDGTPVKISSDGFEGELQQIFAKNKLNKALIFDQIYFDSGSNKINAKSDHQIQVTAALMNTYPKTSILLRGHTDSKGSPKKNIELSLMRANSMGLALGSLGIDTERIRILGMGDAFPIGSNDTEKGRKKNRRIEILLQ